METAFSYRLDDADVAAYRWSAADRSRCKAVILLAHGMSEHMGRYRWLADQLVLHGYTVYGQDWVGHGHTRKASVGLGNLGPDGFNQMARAIHELRRIAEDEMPGVPVVLAAHSLGSFAALRYVEQQGEGLAGLVLSGSSGKEGPLLHLGVFLAARVDAKRGDGCHSKLVTFLAFGHYNKRIPRHKTTLDWLTRDDAAVAAYIGDPLCGAPLTASSLRDFFRGLQDIHRREHWARIPRALPILLISGAEDPVGHYGRGVRALERSLGQHGVADLSTKLYAGARHEMFHEVNREEVVQDLLAWLDERYG